MQHITFKMLPCPLTGLLEEVNLPCGKKKTAEVSSKNYHKMPLLSGDQTLFVHIMILIPYKRKRCSFYGLLTYLPHLTDLAIFRWTIINLLGSRMAAGQLRDCTDNCSNMQG